MSDARRYAVSVDVRCNLILEVDGINREHAMAKVRAALYKRSLTAEEIEQLAVMQLVVRRADVVQAGPPASPELIPDNPEDYEPP